MAERPPDYLFAGSAEELKRLRVQAELLEPSARRLLATLPPAPDAARVLDLGCGALGWLRVLHEWVGDAGEVVGTDLNERLLQGAQALVDETPLPRVRLVKDDVFDSRLEARSFDLVHARFLLTPLGRPHEQLHAYKRLVKPGGLLVVEEPIGSTTWFARPVPATSRLVQHFVQLWSEGGGVVDAGGRLPHLFRAVGLEAQMRADVELIPPGHPYLANLLDVIGPLRNRLKDRVGAEFDALFGQMREELTHPAQWGTTSVLVQAWARVP